MPEFIDIYPTSNYAYLAGNLPFLSARNTASANFSGIYAYLESSTYISGGPSDWKIYRSYIEFDLSGVPGNIVQLDFNASKLYNGDSAAVLVYGGSGSLIGDLNEYSLYLDNSVYSAGTIIPLFEVYDPPMFSPNYYGVTINTTVYPVNPPYTNFIVGLVTKGDINEIEEERFNPTLQGSSSLYPPYLRAHYIPTGYVNTVIGVTGANISTVSGVPSANISKVMGV
jgi:hypothetical protein